MKERLALVLAAVLLVTAVFSAPVYAVEQGSGTASGYEERSFAPQADGAGVGPTLADGNYAQWIDRIANLPDYAGDFYQWLEDNSGVDGCLVNPTKAMKTEKGYVYATGTVSATVAFTYGNGVSVDDAAKSAAVGHAAAYSQVMTEYLSETYSAFHRDHPEVFWLDSMSRYGWSMGYEYTFGSGSGKVTYSMNMLFSLQGDDFDIRDEEYRNVEVLTAAIEKRDADTAKILEGCPTEASVVEQIRYLNQTLTEMNCYNSSPSSATSGYPWSCVSALAGSVGKDGPVCEGYAKAFKVLCDRLGIGCVLVEGDAKSSADGIAGPHMWNYVEVGGAWYAVDVTWNDPTVSGVNSPVSGYEREDWLLLGSETFVNENLTFIQSHPVTNVVSTGGLDFSNGPVLSENAYEEQDNYMDIAPYREGTYTAPVKEGYIFAGWYADPELTSPIGTNVKTGYAYAKFIEESTLSVKYQLTNGTTAQSASTDLRMLTAVDGLNYRAVGFAVQFGGNIQTLYSNTVYEQVRAGNVLISNASALFGADANYFVTYTLRGVPCAAFGMTFTITARWQTLDGTWVEGTPRSFAISDTF